jgi:hypothetical protein
MRQAVIAALLLTVAAPCAAQGQPSLAAPAITHDELCGPQAVLKAPSAAIKIAGGGERMKKLFGLNEAVIVNAGTAQGVRPGQRWVVRRVVPDRFAHPSIGQQPISIHTAGWITILESQADASVATVSGMCDGIEEGDYLEPLVIPPAVTAVAAGEPDYARPAHVVLGDDRQQAGGSGTLMVMDRGTDHGLRAGQKLTIFRETLDGKGPVAKIGDAVVVTTHPETSLIKIVNSREAVYVGDLIAIHR